MEPGSDQEKEIKGEFGIRLLDRYMDVLSDSDLWLDTAFCWRCSKEKKQKDPRLND